MSADLHIKLLKGGYIKVPSASTKKFIYLFILKLIRIFILV